MKYLLRNLSKFWCSVIRWWTLVNPNQRVKQDQDSSRESIYRKLFSVQVKKNGSCNILFLKKNMLIFCHLFKKRFQLLFFCVFITDRWFLCFSPLCIYICIYVYTSYLEKSRHPGNWLPSLRG